MIQNAQNSKTLTKTSALETDASLAGQRFTPFAWRGQTEVVTPTPLIAQPAELGFAGELLSWLSTMGVLPLSLVEPGFHNVSYSVHGEITLGIHEAEIPAIALTSWKRMGLVRAY